MLPMLIPAMIARTSNIDTNKKYKPTRGEIPLTFIRTESDSLLFEVWIFSIKTVEQILNPIDEKLRNR